jgi:hypothetical protein
MPAVTIVAAWISAEPGLQRELRGLAAGGEQQHQADRGQQALRGPADPAQHAGEGHRAEPREHQHDRDRQPGVADPVGDERLVRGGGIARVGVPEADQQVGGQADALPPDVQQQVGVGEHQQQHRRDEQVEVGEEPPAVRVVLHVRHGVHQDQRPDERHQQHEGHRQRVEQQPGVDLEGAGRHPREQVQLARALLRLVPAQAE